MLMKKSVKFDLNTSRLRTNGAFVTEIVTLQVSDPFFTL